jgi:hypothetical protein
MLLDLVDNIRVNSKLLQLIVRANLTQERSFDLVIIGEHIYEYEVAMILGLPYIQVVNNPFGIMQLFNDVLAPQSSSQSRSYLNQVYPELLTSRFSLISRLVNHISILQQELMLKPLLNMAYIKGI